MLGYYNTNSVFLFISRGPGRLLRASGRRQIHVPKQACGLVATPYMSADELFQMSFGLKLHVTYMHYTVEPPNPPISKKRSTVLFHGPL